MAMSSNNSWHTDASYRLCTSTQKRLKYSEETLSSTSQMVKMGITSNILPKLVIIDSNRITILSRNDSSLFVTQLSH